MRPLVTPEAMARADARTISSGVPAETLMERAGRAIARAALRELGARYGSRVAIVCGKGNNGGDGFVVARLLRREGVAVSCFAITVLDEYTGAAKHHLDRLGRHQVRSFPPSDTAFDLGIDALFGTGFHGSAEGEAAAAIEWLNDLDAPVIAIDIPSGVNGETGAVTGPAVYATRTVALAAEKLGTAAGKGAVLAGFVEVEDIGISVDEPTTWRVERADVAATLPEREPDAHKRSGGAVVVIGGSPGMSGAALLSARGAVRMGAGYATVVCDDATEVAVSSALPEVLSVAVGSGPMGPGALDVAAEVLERADAVALGPGLGRGDSQRALVEEALAKIDLPLVLDADGLNAIASDPSALERRSAPVAITPHPAELARLLAVSVDDLQSDRLGHALRAADRFGCVVLLKGFHSIIATPAGHAYVNPTGGPELATAGTGDVLTGALAALLAAGLEVQEASWTSAFVHGLAGAVAGSHLGPDGVQAWDVAEALPEATALVRL